MRWEQVLAGFLLGLAFGFDLGSERWGTAVLMLARSCRCGGGYTNARRIRHAPDSSRVE